MTDRQYDNRIKKLIELKLAKKELESQISAIQNELKSEMGDEVTVETSHFIIKTTSYNRCSLDTQGLKADLPDVYKMYSYNTVVNTFTYTEKVR